MSITTVLLSSLTQNRVLIVKANALTTQSLIFFSVSKRFLLKENHDAIINIFQRKRREDKNANELLPITQFCFLFHLDTDFITKFPDLKAH